MSGLQTSPEQYEAARDDFDRKCYEQKLSEEEIYNILQEVCRNIQEDKGSLRKRLHTMLKNKGDSNKF